MRKINFIIMACMLAGLAVSCSKDVDNPIEAFPFQETEDGKWGMVTMDGKVLCSEKFEQAPTVVTDGRFFAKNDDDLWVLYEASEKTNKIGGKFVSVSCFYDGVALVTEKNKPVSLIDKEGKTVKLLDKIEGKVVSGVRQFQQGYAVFETIDGFMGVIDTKGNCVIKPEYVVLTNCSDGKLLGIDKKYKEDWENSDRSKVKVSVVNTKGDQISNFSLSKYDEIGIGFTDGLLPVAVRKKGEIAWGLIDEKGETVVKPSDKIKGIGSVSGDKFTFYNGKKWGLMNTKGETVIRAKYEDLQLDCGNILIAKNDDGEFLILNDKGEKISETDDYEIYKLFSDFDGKHNIVQLDDHNYSIIDRKGKVLKKVPDIVDFSMNRGNEIVRSDYVDFEALISELKISKDGMQGITLDTTPEKIVDMIPELRNDTSYCQYLGRDVLNFERNIYGSPCDFAIGYGESIVTQDENWDCKWNECTPIGMSVSIGHYGILNGKLRDFYNVLSGKVIGWGSVVKKNDGAAVVSLGNDKYVIVAMTPYQVVLAWGHKELVDTLDISQFANVQEEGFSDYPMMDTPVEVTEDTMYYDYEDPYYGEAIEATADSAYYY